jgi:hypothetical protein
MSLHEPMFKLFPCRNYPAGVELRFVDRLEHLRPPMENFSATFLYGCRAEGLR